MNKVDSWFWLEEIEVLADSSTKGAIVTFGDSITDGVQQFPMKIIGGPIILLIEYKRNLRILN